MTSCLKSKRLRKNRIFNFSKYITHLVKRTKQIVTNVYRVPE